MERENKLTTLEELFRTGNWKYVVAEGLDFAFVPSSTIRYARRNMPENAGTMKKTLVYGLAGVAKLLRFENYDMICKGLFSS